MIFYCWKAPYIRPLGLHFWRLLQEVVFSNRSTKAFYLWAYGGLWAYGSTLLGGGVIRFDRRNRSPARTLQLAWHD